jgi:hypothetical protein
MNNGHWNKIIEEACRNGNASNKNDFEKKTKKQLLDLKRYANSIGLGNELAGQASVIFAVDQQDFANIYGKLSIGAGTAMKEFRDTLKEFLQNTGLYVLLIIDDCDMIMNQKLIPGLVWGSLYLTENVPLCRIIATSQQLLSFLVGGKDKDKGITGSVLEGWLRKAKGREVAFSSMNEIRKVVFLSKPHPLKIKKERTDGRVIWAEALYSRPYERDGLSGEYNINFEYTETIYDKFIKDLVTSDWRVGYGSDKTRLMEYQVNELLESKDIKCLKNEQPTDEDKKRSELMYGFLRLFPTNRREAVEVTNLLIDQREQILNEKYRLPFDLSITWRTFEERLFRALMCIGFERWRGSVLGSMLWNKPTEFHKAFETKVIKRKQEKYEVEIAADEEIDLSNKIPKVIKSELKQLRKNLNSEEPQKETDIKLSSEERELQHLLLWMIVCVTDEISKSIQKNLEEFDRLI